MRAAHRPTMKRSKSRTVDATPAQWAGIGECAQVAGMNVSRFLVACCLHDDEAGETPPAREAAAGAERLALSEVEQRALHGAARRMDACCRAVLEPMPRASMSVLEALDFVQRGHERLAQERDAVLRQDGEWLG